jgi:hypothetical protein
MNGVPRQLKLTWWAGKDLHLGRHKPADLQSAPFDCFGTDPRIVSICLKSKTEEQRCCENKRARIVHRFQSG